MDVGAKFCAMDYILHKKINYEYILMLHSKTNNRKRKEYILPFITKIPTISFDSKSDIGVYFGTRLYQGNRVLRKERITHSNWGGNKMHMEILDNVMNLPDYKKIFPEGNVYILKRVVAEYMFDNRFDIYNKLNTVDSFDYSWFVNFYRLHHLTYEEAFDKFKNEKLFGNNLATRMVNMNRKKGIPDYMIEHAMERVVFGVCMKCNTRFKNLTQPNL
jgi:hypothetical protein